MKTLRIVGDNCNELYHGEHPVHGPLSELDPTAGDDQASLVYAQLPVPAQLTVRPSVIPGAGLGVFAVSRINKGVRLDLMKAGKWPGKIWGTFTILPLHGR